MKTLKLSGLIATALLIQGCSASLDQDFHLSGNAEGIKRFNDGLIAVINSTKASPDTPSEYFAHRGKEEREATERLKTTSFWNKISGGAK
jgi:hypothetical protein